MREKKNNFFKRKIILAKYQTCDPQFLFKISHKCLKKTSNQKEENEISKRITKRKIKDFKSK